MIDKGVSPVNELPRLPRRAADSHKGTFGKVLIIGGSRGMSGAAVLCGRAALRGGAGLVQVACPACVQDVIAAGHPGYTTFGIRQHADGTFSEGAADDLVELGRGADAVAIGPGLGHAPDSIALVRRVVQELPRTPIAIDADGLNSLAPFTNEFQQRPSPLVLTPHPGEFSRLSGLAIAAIQSQREKTSVEFARKFGVVLLLKGAATIVTDGTRLYRNTTGNPGLATGGSGDVLTGLLAALLGQKRAPFEAAMFAAWVHGRAGDLAAIELGQAGLIAADLPEYLPKVFKELEDAN